MEWLNPPPEWSEENGILNVVTGDRTDFWQRTHYGFRRDNGHFRFTRVTGDFTARLTFGADYGTLYDQAGLMVRTGPECWMKTGLEYTDGEPHFSVVATNAFSDWSVQPLPREALATLTVQVARYADVLQIRFAVGGGPLRLARLCRLPLPEEVMVGPMCCTPERDGLRVRFEQLEIGPPSRDLH